MLVARLFYSWEYANSQALAVGLLFVAARFQISDGRQVGAGASRGLKITTAPMWITFLSY
jgi:hypothetical protein